MSIRFDKFNKSNVELLEGFWVLDLWFAHNEPIATVLIEVQNVRR